MLEQIISVIPANKIAEKNERKVTRVVIYVRVSTSKKEQVRSFNNQIDYFRNKIDKREDWRLVNIYADEGTTGTNTKNRSQFLQMIEDAKKGEFDLIITKSISRFARNTLDTIKYTRLLKSLNVGVYFEKDNLWTLSDDGEFILTVIAAVAQEESRSISENTKWGMRKNMAKGKGCLAFSSFLGYDRGDDGGYLINEEQAEIVKRIYNSFLEGYTLKDITLLLEKDEIRTVKGKEKWDTATVLSILQNEKYIGDCLMQKYYILDPITKKLLKNNGEIDRIYVINHHKAIVDNDTWEKVQFRLIKAVNKTHASALLKRNFFMGMLYCSACDRKCGKMINTKVDYSGTNYETCSYVIHSCASNGTSPKIREKNLILLIYDSILEYLVIKKKETKSRKPIFENEYIQVRTEEKIKISLLLIHKLIDRIIVLPDTKLQINYYDGKVECVNYADYEYDERLKQAKDFIYTQDEI